jgi:hypothetical protein
LAQQYEQEENGKTKALRVWARNGRQLLENLVHHMKRRIAYLFSSNNMHRETATKCGNK